MTQMPLSVLFAFGVLIAWPLIKVVTVIFARKYWAKLRTLEASLLNDAAYCNNEDKKIISREVDDARHQPLFLLIPAVVLFGGIGFAIAEIVGKSDIISDMSDMEEASATQISSVIYGNRPIVRDDRFRKLTDITFMLSALNYPICSGLTAIAILIVAPLIFIAGGLKTSVRTVVERVIRSSVIATLVFGRGIGTPRIA